MGAHVESWTNVERTHAPRKDFRVHRCHRRRFKADRIVMATVARMEGLGRCQPLSPRKAGPLTCHCHPTGRPGLRHPTNLLLRACNSRARKGEQRGLNECGVGVHVEAGKFAVAYAPE